MKYLAVVFLALAFLVTRIDVAPIPTPMIQTYLPASRADRRAKQKSNVYGIPYYAPFR